MPLADPRAFLRRLAEAAIARAAPDRVAEHLPPKPAGRTVVVGAGKASAAMARAFEAAWPHPLDGLVVTRYGHAVPCRRIEVVEAAHPVPDAAGADAARHILDLVSGLGPDDLVVALMSGGGSALLTLPAAGLTLADLQAVNAALLRSGADIGAMNTLRKHLSAIAGGRLAAAAHPARLWTLAISDVPGDDPAVIASGPTVPDPTTLAEARAVVARYNLALPAAAAARLDDPAAETPKPGHPAFRNAAFRLVARPLESLLAAAELARAAGITPLILGDALTGEAREVGTAMAGIARAVAEHDLPVAKPAVLLSGGETTVTVRGTGKGGRNSEFLLGFALAAAGLPGTFALAIDTDGIDGSEDNAGAIATPDTLARLEAAGCDPAALLANNDAYSAFAAISNLVVTGPTHTNVNDFRAVLVM
ncbi:glycerate kinase type-2 family protein [Blastochloris sulfoviridis]|uniref:Glycerate kinase n=1 Tax=Blastochloris sulfoviridis TaxID=50712 RepID=A0A5M6HVA1_9HYPH|nr:glycerate kinase [Blastochloris sulfoviridis]KAA5599617.1 glycerate kinase [Blastochloris sulfoviridis]